MLEKLECYFVGDRTYIQGSQIILKTHLCLQEKNISKQVILQEAKFSNISKNEIFISESKICELKLIGQIVFSVDLTEQTIYVYSNEVEIKRRIAENHPLDYHFIHQSELNGKIEFTAQQQNFESIICTLISANKKLHNDLTENSHDIWFTGLRKASIPTTDSKLPSKGVVTFKHLMTVGKVNHQTLTEVSISDSSGKQNLKPFIISFTYKS